MGPRNLSILPREPVLLKVSLTKTEKKISKFHSLVISNLLFTPKPKRCKELLTKTSLFSKLKELNAVKFLLLLNMSHTLKKWTKNLKKVLALKLDMTILTKKRKKTSQ